MGQVQFMVLKEKFCPHLDLVSPSSNQMIPKMSWNFKYLLGNHAVCINYLDGMFRVLFQVQRTMYFFLNVFLFFYFFPVSYYSATSVSGIRTAPPLPISHLYFWMWIAQSAKLLLNLHGVGGVSSSQLWRELLRINRLWCYAASDPS